MQCESVKGLCGFDVESRLGPLVAALQASADVPPRRLGQMISRWPGVLALTNLDVLEVTAFLEHEALLPIERYAPASILTWSLSLTTSNTHPYGPVAAPVQC